MTKKLLIGILLVFFLPWVIAVDINTDVVLNTSISNSSITFSIPITTDNIKIEATSINITNATYTLGNLRSCDIFWDTENTNLDSADFGCASIEDITPPTFDNLRNFTHTINTSFSQYITASDDSGIDSYWLNQTDYFNINQFTGLITNITNLSRIELWWLIISVNDTYGNEENGEFWINITEAIPPSNVTITTTTLCKYKKLGFYNLRLPWMREVNCV